MIKTITLTTAIIILLFVNPLKIEDSKICSNIPYFDSQCIGYSNTKAIIVNELEGD